MRRSSLLALLSLAAACGTPPEELAAGGGSGGGDSSGAGGGSQQVADDLPCDVAALMTAKCVSCHGDPPSQSAPFKLMTYADFTAQSPSVSGQTVAQRSLTRMKATQNPMPPVYAPQATQAEVQAFESWVNGGLTKGSCNPMGPPDAGPPQLTCASGSYWTSGNHGSANMNPGLACKACHVRDEPGRNYAFMGTVYAGLHEKDLCNARVPFGTKVEILDMAGNVKLTLQVSGAGNFYNTSRSAGFALPYRARVTAFGRSIEMQTPQTDGDCNGCHTALGANGAPGRIIGPPTN